MVSGRANKISIFLFLIILFSIFAIVFWGSVKVSARTIYVPRDYERIQWAVGNASAGYTIIVSPGIYYENVIIDKSLTLLGENGNTTIVGNGTGHVVTVNASSVTICGFTIKNSGSNWGESGIHLLNSMWCNISYNTLTQNTHGIWADFSSNNNIITGNNIYNNSVGIGIIDSSGNVVTNNYIYSNKYCGMGLTNAYNTILASNIAENNDHGIYLVYCSNFTVVGNTFFHNRGQIYLNASNDNTIFHNNFNDTHKAEIINSANIWTSNFEGNYWSTYVGVDANHDGIGDNLYAISANNADNYPLMGPFSDFTITWEGQLHHVTTVSNSAISDFTFKSKTISFNVTGESGTAGFCRICIPTALMNGNFTIQINGVNTPYTRLPSSNATYNYLYFAYSHSTKNVVIHANSGQ